MERHIRLIVGFVVAVVIILVDIITLLATPFFIPLFVVAILIGSSQHFIEFLRHLAGQKGLEKNFPEFVRDIVGSVKSGMPIAKSIQHVSDTDYGALSPYVRKLANQLEWSIPVHKALRTFAGDTNNRMIQRAIATVIEAEQSGGDIGDVLDTITHSLIEIKRIKQTRTATIHSQIVQSYIIFFVFLGVMIIIQNVLVGYVGDIGGGDITGLAAQNTFGEMRKSVDVDFSGFSVLVDSLKSWFISMHGIFLMLTVIQGLFAGLIVGKLAEGDVRSGFKHSVIFVTLAIIVMSIAQGYAV